MICTILGKKSKTYTDKKTGEEKNLRILYVVKDRSRSTDETLEGRETEQVFVPFDISDVHVGKKYNFVYERNGNYISLEDIIPCESK